MDKSPVVVVEKPLWAHAVLVLLLFFASALLVVGILALVFDTVP